MRPRRLDSSGKFICCLCRVTSDGDVILMHQVCNEMGVFVGVGVNVRELGELLLKEGYLRGRHLVHSGQELCAAHVQSHNDFVKVRIDGFLSPHS